MEGYDMDAERCAANRINPDRDFHFPGKTTSAFIIRTDRCSNSMGKMEGDLNNDVPHGYTRFAT